MTPLENAHFQVPRRISAPLNPSPIGGFRVAKRAAQTPAMCAAMVSTLITTSICQSRRNNSYWMRSRSTFPGGFEDTGTEVKVPSES